MVALVSFGLIVGGPVLSLWMMSLPPIETSCGVGCTQNHESPLEQPWVGAILLVGGAVLLAVALQLDHRAGARRRTGWKTLWSWGAPLIWLAVIPVIAGPATFLIAGSNAYDRSCHVSFGWFSGGSDCPPRVYLPSVVIPGLLNLVPIWWLLRARGRRRLLAAVVATVLGIAGLATSVIVLFALGPEIDWNFGLYGPNPPPTQAADFSFGVVFWLMAIIALLVIAKLPDHGPVRVSPPLPG